MKLTLNYTTQISRNLKTMLLIFFIISSTLMFSCTHLGNTPKSNANYVVPKLYDYETYHAFNSSIQKTLKTSGRIVSANEQNLYFDCKGAAIKQLYVYTGSKVKIGDVLGELYTDDLDEKIMEKEENIKIAQITLEQLMQQRAGNYDIKKAALLIESEKVRLVMLKKELEKRKLVSEINGVVTFSAPLKPSQIISEKTLIYTISDPAKIQIECTENSIKELTVGMKANILYKNIPYQGEVVSYPATQNKKNYMEAMPSLAYISFYTQPEKYEIGDLSVSLEIVVMEKNNVLVIPRMAVHYTNNQKYVLVYKKEIINDRFVRTRLKNKYLVEPVDYRGVVTERYIQTGIIDDSNVEVIEGLSPGEQVIGG